METQTIYQYEKFLGEYIQFSSKCVIGTVRQCKNNPHFSNSLLFIKKIFRKMKQRIRINENQLGQIIKEALTDYMVANDGGYVSDDGYSMDGLDDARWEREHQRQVAQEWNGFPEDIFNEYDLISDGTTTPDEVVKNLSNDKDEPWCYRIGLIRLWQNKKYRKYAKSFAQYLLTRGGLSKNVEQDEINRLKGCYEDCRDTANNILKR